VRSVTLWFYSVNHQGIIIKLQLLTTEFTETRSFFNCSEEPSDVVL